MEMNQDHPWRWRADRPPTSRDVNTAIEVIRRAGAADELMAIIDLWNAARLVDAARSTETNEELRSLFAGLGARSLTSAGTF